jgi:hypothetical protein
MLLSVAAAVDKRVKKAKKSRRAMTAREKEEAAEAELRAEDEGAGSEEEPLTARTYGKEAAQRRVRLPTHTFDSLHCIQSTMSASVAS